VVMVERGAFPGAKNVYGGVVYGRILDEVVPQWWTEVPVQRWVTRRATMLMTSTQALTVDYRTSAWDRPPYNGMTTYRADFDTWLAGKAVTAGARLISSTVATGLLRDSAGRIAGVRTDRPDGDIRARIVIACDGVNSFLAKEAGLLPRTSPAHTTLGVKETLALPREVIDKRFGLVGDQGMDIEMVGCTSGIPGGGFLYTNLDTVNVGVVVGLEGLAEAKIRPEELVAGAGILGVTASIAAYRDGGPWLDQLLGLLDRNRRLFGDLLTDRLPGVGYVPPQGTYLAWLDCTRLELPGEPAKVFLKKGRVALRRGSDFGSVGTGWARATIATAPEILAEIVERMRTAVG